MKNEVAVEELLAVLEKIRAEKYPDIPEDLIGSIVLAEYENQDDQGEGHRLVKKAIDDFLRSAVVVGEGEI